MLDKHILGLPAGVWCGAAAMGAVGLLGAILGGAPAVVTVAMALAASAGVVLLWNTHWGLCFAAFAIAPLGAVRHEVAGITFYLPEVLMLALFMKEGLRFVLRREHFTPPFPARTLGLYLCVACAAIATGIFRENGVVRTLQDFRQFTEFVALFWLVLYRLDTRREALEVLTGFVAGATVCAVHAILQHGVATGLIGAQYADALFYRGLRSGSFHHANALGGLLVLAVGAAAGMALSSTRRSVRCVLLVCIGLCLVAEVYTKSRAAWLSMAICLAFIVVAVRPPAKTLAWAVAGALVFAAAMWPAVTQRVSTFGDPQEDRSFMDRTQYYTAASYILRAHPWLGLGWGCYYEVPKIIAHKQYVVTPRPPEVLDATVHSLYLQLPVKMGVFGLLTFLLLLLAWLEIVWRAFRTRPRRAPEFALFAGVTAGLVGFFLQSGIENYFHHPVMAQSFWLLFGLSFLSAHWTAVPPVSYRAPAMILGGVSVVFALFIGFCLWLAKLDADPPYFEYNIHDALAAGKPEKALNIALTATQGERPVPLAHALYGKLLLDRGRNDEALVEFEKVFAIRRDYLPPYHETRKPFYLAAGRLALGQYWLGLGNVAEAAANFELARAYDTPSEPRFQEYHVLLYETYASLGRWDRALEFGEPSGKALQELGGEDLAAISAICRDHKKWDLARHAAEQLLTREGWTTRGQYLLGRLHLAQNQFEAALAPLEQAAAGGQAHAAYFLGVVFEHAGQPEQALAAYRDVAPGDPFRSFALERLLALLPESGEHQSLLEARDQEITAILQDTAAPALFEKEQGLNLAAVRCPAADPGDGGELFVMLLWQGPDASAGIPAVEPGDTLSGQGLVLRHGDYVLQLQQTRNLLEWESLDRLPEGPGPIPGWIDTARDWFNIRSQYTVRVEREGAGKTRLTFPRLTWFYTFPMRVQDGKSYLLTADLKGNTRVGWQALDLDENLAAEGDLPRQDNADDWSSAYGLLRAQPSWDALRIRLDVLAESEENAADRLALFEIYPPGEALSDAQP